MVIGTLARKDLRLLLRDPRALIILLVMPFIFILVLGVSLGESFGQKPDNLLRVSVLVEDTGPPKASGAWVPNINWSDVVLQDLSETKDIKLEIIESRADAEALVRRSKRPAVLILGPKFSKRVTQASFLGGDVGKALLLGGAFPQPAAPVQLALAGLHNDQQGAVPLYVLDGMNPFHREGITLEKLDVTVLRDPTQPTAAAIIEQVTQGTLLRVVLPWMIGRAFEKLGEEAFIERLSERITVPGNLGGPAFKPLKLLSGTQKQAVGAGVQTAIKEQFSKYDLTAKTWAALTRADPTGKSALPPVTYRPDDIRYALLVPSYTVMFAFFLVLTVGWLFVAERRQGTLKRLHAAPIGNWQILLGKLLPCLALSLFQGFFLLGAGKLVFGMSWGPAPLWLIPVVCSTSLAAMGLALLVAALARTETQVAIYGTLLVLVLAGLSGCLMGDRSLMPELMEQISHVTPHAWALDAYRELLLKPEPQGWIVAQSCLALVGFGVGFLGLAWAALKWE